VAGGAAVRVNKKNFSAFRNGRSPYVESGISIYFIPILTKKC